MKDIPPVVLVILDGFGYDKDATESPWQKSNHPNFSKIEQYYPLTTLQASGIAVGLPWGEEGNSEVGHLTIGAGRIIYNHLPRIIMSISDGSFFKNTAFLEAVEHVKKNNSRLHIMGLFSSGSVHAYHEHLYALMDLAKRNSPAGELKTYLHLFTDGKDASPTEGIEYIKKLESELEKNYPNIKLASIIGRHFSLDRDGKWDRIEKAYNLLTQKRGENFNYASLFIEQKYKQGITDEMMPPAFADLPAGKAETTAGERIQNGDAVIFFNYREDSARELTAAFVQQNFDKFPRTKVADLKFITMTEYSSDLKTLIAFPPIEIKKPLAKILSLAGLKQLHIAETEKYAHVTYFFNGGEENPFGNEDRILIPSAKVSRYDESPKMSARQITEKVLQSLGNYHFIIINYANADMVGHTGNFEACVKAIETLDKYVGQLIPKILEKNGVALITSDHGNVEEKIYKMTGGKMTKHTTNPVPFYLVGKMWERKNPLNEEEILKEYQETNGMLTDVAPTVLDILGLPKPAEMTGQSLISKLK